METIKLVIVGYGGMGSYHARELIKESEGILVHGIYDVDDVRLGMGREAGFKVYSSLEEVLSDEEVEAVLIATPNDTHCDIAIKALEAGKHVVCEKPVMMSTEELDAVLLVAKDTGKVFMVHQNRRWDADFLMIASLYETQPIGEVFQLESRVHGANGIPGDWRHMKQHGGGMLLDWGVHLLDQLLYLIDSPVKKVAADLSFILGDDVDDGFISYLTFENDVKAVVEVGTTNFVTLPRWYIKGLEGSGVIYDWDLSGQIVKQTGAIDHHNLIPIKAGQGLTKTMAPPSEEATTRFDLPEGKVMTTTFYQNFYDVIRKNAEPVVKNTEVRRVLALIETIFEAHNTGQVMPFE